MAVRWSAADNEAVEEAIMRAQSGLLSIGVKT